MWAHGLNIIGNLSNDIFSWWQRKTFEDIGPKENPITTPAVCLKLFHQTWTYYFVL